MGTPSAHTACPFPPGGWILWAGRSCRSRSVRWTNRKHFFEQALARGRDRQAFPVDEPVPVAEVEGVYLVVAVEMHDDRHGPERGPAQPDQVDHAESWVGHQDHEVCRQAERQAGTVAVAGQRRCHPARALDDADIGRTVRPAGVDLGDEIVDVGGGMPSASAAMGGAMASGIGPAGGHTIWARFARRPRREFRCRWTHRARRTGPVCGPRPQPLRLASPRRSRAPVKVLPTSVPVPVTSTTRRGFTPAAPGLRPAGPDRPRNGRRTGTPAAGWYQSEP